MDVQPEHAVYLDGMVAVVMGVVRIEPGLGIAFAVLAIPAVLHSAAIAAKAVALGPRPVRATED